MNAADLIKLSPFEFKDELIKLASSESDRMMLNAGRGNPNFLAVLPREAFLRLGIFAVNEATRSYSYLHAGLGGAPEKKGIVNRFDTYAVRMEHKRGVDFLNSALSFAVDHMGISKEDFLYEMVEAFLGCNYPCPPISLDICGEIIKKYLALELCGDSTRSEVFDIFSTEGGTAAMTYFFQTLQLNGMIDKGDKVAMGTPIFSPYLEIPVLPQYGLEVVPIRADEKEWQLSKEEIDKLADPKIKVFCLVNPSNPPSVKMSEETLDYLAKFVKEKRPDLMIVTDDVYGTFADNFTSLFAVCPYNTLCVYSFSKYFGATGWRIGTMTLHKENVFDEIVQNLPEKTKKRLDERYVSLTTEPRALKFIDRLVADSRAVALNHTAGLSLPQQLQMTMFALSSLMDEGSKYKKTTKRLIRRRYSILYHAMGLHPTRDENRVDYYTILDLERLGKKVYGEKFANWFMKQKDTGAEFLIHLAKETGVVLLPAGGFEVLKPAVRVSLANLTEHDYRAIGLSVRKALDDYYEKFTKGGK